MKKFYLFLAVVLSAVTANAQCGNGRFHYFVFSTQTITSNVVYGSNLDKNGTVITLKMDIYEPAGDTSISRPLVVLAHGGSFIGGSKTGTDVVPLAKDLSKLGYVVASIDYRLGMTHFPVGGPPDSTDAGAAVMRAVHDGRAAVRFFRKNVATGGNTYKIDTNNIYFAGVSAGGFIALHLAYMDQWSEFPTYVDTVAQQGLHGGIEGQSGNPGYSSNVKAIVNICGAIGDTAWIHAGDEPLLSFHGTNDNTVPFATDTIYLLGSYPLLVVDGSATIAQRANEVGLENCFDIYWGQDHVPEVSNASYYDTTIVITRNFLEHQVCGVPLQCGYTSPILAGIDEAAVNTNDASIYPNPANSSFTIQLADLKGGHAVIQLFDAKGIRVLSAQTDKTNYSIDRSGLAPGIYLVKISLNNHEIIKKLILN